MSRHGGPGALRAAERLPGLRALRALLRRVLGRAGPDPHRLLAHPRRRRDPLFDTGLSPRAVPGLMRNDPMARFTTSDLLANRLDALGLEPDNVDLVVISHLHYDHAGGAQLFPKSELVVQRDEYAYAHYPAPFFEGFYYRKNFDLPGYRWRLLDGDTELMPGVTALRTDGHTPGHQSLLVELPETGPVILAGDPCYWQEHIDKE